MEARKNKWHMLYYSDTLYRTPPQQILMHVIRFVEQ